MPEQLSQNSAIIIAQHAPDEQLDRIRKELSEFEKQIRQNFAELNSADVGRTGGVWAGGMSGKAYEAAKETIAKLKSKKD